MENLNAFIAPVFAGPETLSNLAGLPSLQKAAWMVSGPARQQVRVKALRSWASLQDDSEQAAKAETILLAETIAQHYGTKSRRLIPGDIPGRQSPSHQAWGRAIACSANCYSAGKDWSINSAGMAIRALSAELTLAVYLEGMNVPSWAQGAKQKAFAAVEAVSLLFQEAGLASVVPSFSTQEDLTWSCLEHEGQSILSFDLEEGMEEAKSLPVQLAQAAFECAVFRAAWYRGQKATVKDFYEVVCELWEANKPTPAPVEAQEEGLYGVWRAE